jgi:hypothetical protein
MPDITNAESISALRAPQEAPPPRVPAKPIIGGEQTRMQAVIASPWVMRWAAMPSTYSTYREIRRDPTVALARVVATAPIMASGWSYQAEDGVSDEWVRFIRRQIDHVRTTYLENALFYGNIDFGYQGFEQVFEHDSSGRVVLKKLKPLLQDITEIILDSNGGFAGFSQPSARLEPANAVHVGFRVEGSYLYGSPLLENVRKAYIAWQEANEAAGRYDRKVAGAMIVVHYPKGSSYDANGVETPNDVLAKNVVHKLESSGTVAIPRDVAQLIETAGLDNPGWKIEVIADGGGQQSSFVERLQYLDKLKVRGILLPERAALEGQHGTLAEAEAHADVALTQADLTHQYIVDCLNEQVVGPLLALNFGEDAREAVKVVPSPVVDDKKTFLREIVRTLLANPGYLAQFLADTDTDALMDALGLPKAQEVAGSNLRPTVPVPGVDPNDPQAQAIQQVYAKMSNAGQVSCGPGKQIHGKEVHWVTINGHPTPVFGDAPKGVKSKTVIAKKNPPKKDPSKKSESEKSNPKQPESKPAEPSGHKDKQAESKPSSDSSPHSAGREIADHKTWSDEHDGPPIPKESMKTVKWYQHNGYNTLNAILRSGKPAPSWSTELSTVDKAISTAAPLKEAIVVHRGMTKVPEGLKEGAVIHDKAYVSTTTDAKIAQDFAGKSPGGCEFRITLPKGHRVLSMEHATKSKQFSREKEVLLPRNAQFRVTKVEKSGDRTIAHLEYTGSTT